MLGAVSFSINPVVQYILMLNYILACYLKTSVRILESVLTNCVCHSIFVSGQIFSLPIAADHMGRMQHGLFHLL